MAAHTLRDVFRHDLGELYDAEQQSLGLLGDLETETESRELRDRIRAHREETRRQTINLERCFELQGIGSSISRCVVMHGLREQKRHFMATHTPSSTALELYNLETIIKAKQYEITSYSVLMVRAAVLEEDDVRRLLEQNQRQETAMAEWIDTHHRVYVETLRPLRMAAT